ncbi:ankyrin repeat-containing domain protein [Sporodiniella umbellata]|nr:ankyrin repeat-containing domain protein [Sporodiniella umbellata]
MPTLLSRTFALLSSTKLPMEPRLNSRILQEEVCSQEPQHIAIELEEPVEKPESTIWKAAEEGDLVALQYFIENSTTDPSRLLNQRDPESDCTLLHLVIVHAKEHQLPVLPLLRFLLDQGAEATLCNIYNVQAIHMIPLHCEDQPLACMDLLLDHRVDINVHDGDGWTPLHYAARFCQTPEPILQRLVERGADVNRRDVRNKTPLFVLLANGDYSDALHWLIHTAKADLSLLGDFVDLNTHQTIRGSLILQATKYKRTQSLAFLIRSSLRVLRKVVAPEEIALAYQYAQDEPELLDLLKELEDLLIHPSNLTYSRRPSIMTVLGLTSTSSNGLFKRASRILRRTKSEGVK